MKFSKIIVSFLLGFIIFLVMGFFIRFIILGKKLVFGLGFIFNYLVIFIIEVIYIVYL